MAVSLTDGLASPLLLRLLADGQLHSGEHLARQLGISRAAVWKGIEKLRLRGIDVRSIARRGYTLPCAIELLAEAPVRAAISPERVGRVDRLDVLFDVDSTNTRLLDTPPPSEGHANVVMTELQHAGRGRRGRRWIAPFGGSLALSLGWSFADAAHAAPTLSLCVGVAVAKALIRAGARGIQLKWPNDLWHADRKLGGVLLELRAEASGPAYVVIGVGLNVALAPAARLHIEAQGVRVAAVADACALSKISPDGSPSRAESPSRNFIAGAIIDELLSMLHGFELHGFEPFREAWAALDAMRDRRAWLMMGDRVVVGTARGVSATGALRLEGDSGVQEFVSGEVSLRLVGDAI